MIQKTKRIKKKIDWDNATKYKDNSCMYELIYVVYDDENIYIKLHSNYAKYSERTFYFIISEYKDLSVCEILEYFENIGYNTRHINDAIIDVFKEQNLSLGDCKITYFKTIKY